MFVSPQYDPVPDMIAKIRKGEGDFESAIGVIKKYATNHFRAVTEPTAEQWRALGVSGEDELRAAYAQARGMAPGPVAEFAPDQEPV